MRESFIALYFVLNLCAFMGPFMFDDVNHMEGACKGYSIAGVILTPGWHVACSFRREEGYGHRFLHELFKTRE